MLRYCRRIKHRNESLRSSISDLISSGKESNYLSHHRSQASAWSKRQAKHRKDWEREVLIDRNMQLLKGIKKLRGPGARLIMDVGAGCSGSHMVSKTLPSTMTVPVRQERVQRFVRTPWTAEETKLLIKVILKAIEEGTARSGFYKYIEHTYVGQEKPSVLHPSRNASNIRGHWGDLCRTVRDEVLRDAAVALYDLDEETLNKILNLPQSHVPSKGHDDRRIAAVIKKHKELNPDCVTWRGRGLATPI